jgi:hypothetical protein
VESEGKKGVVIISHVFGILTSTQAVFPNIFLSDVNFMKNKVTPVEKP